MNGDKNPPIYTNNINNIKQNEIRQVTSTALTLWRVLAAGSFEIGVNRDRHGLGTGRSVHLTEDAAHVKFDSRPADDQFRRNLVVGQPGDHQLQNGQLAIRQIRVAYNL